MSPAFSVAANLSPTTCKEIGIKALSRDLVDTPTSIGTVHNRLQETAQAAAIALNQTQDL